eukprot:TRINITY_DN3032_c0_g1_i1.p1 TRINITY_DN3032_c0_g1~~TRINITY_DN3032_c0_g1_i1.p1  ORF type:complete len:256 (+),score=22.73 TRINITY_DN3032_c0_g1_i1:38-769(+)
MLRVVFVVALVLHAVAALRRDGKQAKIGGGLSGVIDPVFCAMISYRLFPAMQEVDSSMTCYNLLFAKYCYCSKANSCYVSKKDRPVNDRGKVEKCFTLRSDDPFTNPTCSREDVWKPDWGKNRTSTSLCYEWTTNTDWGALQKGRTLAESCRLQWARDHCPWTCCTYVPLTANSLCNKEDTWQPGWGKDDGKEVPPYKACGSWAENSEWGALKGGRTLTEACKLDFAKESCAQTCCKQLAESE